MKTSLPSLALILIFAGCAGTNQIRSERPSRKVFADADLIEWVDHLTSYENERIRVGVMHDDENVYIAVNTTNRALIQSIMAGGLTLWLNGVGDDSKETGLKYPLGMRDVRRGNADPQRRQDNRARNDLLDLTLSEMDVYFEEDKPIRRSVRANSRFSAAASYDFGAFSVEFIIPRGQDSGSDIFISSLDGLAFGLGIETVEFSGERRAGARQGGAGGRGGRGGRGGGRGGARGASGGGGSAGFSPVDIWLKVDLSE